MPKSVEARQTLRRTWLSSDIWKWLGIEIKVVFIIGRPGGEDLSEEIETFKDLLILDFEENHYGLPYKDVAFLQFVENSCSMVDFVFKGDDDIMLIPQNLKSVVENLRNSNFEATGCLKAKPVPMRSFTKYFIPLQMYPRDDYPAFFSGAAYLTTGNFSISLAKTIPSVPVFPLDDVYIGALAEAAGLRWAKTSKNY